MKQRASATPCSSARRPSSSSSTTCASRRIPYNTGFSLDGSELPSNTGTEYEMGNLGHRPRIKGGYFPVPPVDSAAGHPLRDAVGDGRDGRRRREAPPRGGRRPARARHQVRPDGAAWPTIMQIYKYAVHNVAQAYGKSATFMPKPIFGDNGSGMHCHQSIWKGGKPTFAGNKYADLSDTCLYYIGGILKHAKAHQRLHQPDHQLLQAAGAGLRGAGAARLLGAQPLGVVPHPATSPTRRPSASRCASPIRPPIRTSASRPC